MTRCLSLAVLVLLAACGRTEPVTIRQPVDPVPPEPEHQAVPLPTPIPRPDAGFIVAGECTGVDALCPRGFHCESGTCVLNGDTAELQVTLQWQHVPRFNEDLDLHLIEPTRGGSCEIYYGSGSLFSCSAVGQLDLDANGGCLDSDPSGGPGSDTENIIYPVGQAAPSGHYIVRVDYWSECSGLGADVPFLVTLRQGGQVTERRGVFHPSDADSGEAGSGVTVLEFDVP